MILTCGWTSSAIVVDAADLEHVPAVPLVDRQKDLAAGQQPARWAAGDARIVFDLRDGLAVEPAEHFVGSCRG